MLEDARGEVGVGIKAEFRREGREFQGDGGVSMKIGRKIESVGERGIEIGSEWFCGVGAHPCAWGLAVGEGSGVRA